MKILILSNNNMSGAGRAADRLHKAFLAEGQDSHLWLNSGIASTSTTVVNRGINKYFRLFLSVSSSKVLKLQRSEIKYPRSLSLFRSRLVDKINSSDFDVVNLHWVNGEMLSVRDISRIKKPIVMTLHDMWAFCGAEHYSPDGPDARWRSGYTRQNRLPTDSGLDLDRFTWNRKKLLWKKPFQLVCPSNWLADCVRNSALMGNWPVTVIPNPIDFNTYKPWPKSIAREMYGLPADAKIILFGALGSDGDGRKGQDLLLATLNHLKKKNLPNCHLAIFGQSKPAKEPEIGFPIHWMGHKSDDLSMALFYSAADVMVVPSRMDNLPQTATEAQACGCPVVAFRVGGLKEILDHGLTGNLAEPFNVTRMADGICECLHEPICSANSRVRIWNRAKEIWSQSKVAMQNRNLFFNVSANKKTTYYDDEGQ